ncbi:MAG: hypothetical protein Q9204_005184 [Flavoplaca sp. TL-2023a]
MAETNTLTAGSTEDIDDMVYVSDGDDYNSQPGSMPPSSSVGPAMIPAIKSFYLGERLDRTRRHIVTNQLPDDLPESEETEENGRYALVIRYFRCYDGWKDLAISSIVIQSPMLERVLAGVMGDYPGMAPELARLQFEYPFRSFVHRWQHLVDALYSEQDPETKSHIQLFYDALKTELGPTLETRDDFYNHEIITFESLWMIFTPGDLVITSQNGRQVAAKLTDADEHERVHRLKCEMIHFNGSSVGWGTHWFDIPKFTGMRKINELTVYPLHFHGNVNRITRELIDNGKAYYRLLGVSHKHYRGDALIRHQRSYIDSQIITDSEAYERHLPDLKMCLKSLQKDNMSALDNDESDLFDDEGGITATHIAKSSVPMLTDGQLMVCYNAVRGFSLRNKRWAEFFVHNISDIEWKDNAWDNVVLDQEQKDFIFSVTEGHCDQRRNIQTKGLNVSICGSPGVGKTFMVESLAESLRAPLLHLTPADIDLNAQDADLQSPFTDLLEMCGDWNAILLHEEGYGSLCGNGPFKDGSEMLLLMRALETHSTAFFVNWNGGIKQGTNKRLLSRFHVSLDLPEPTTAMRETIWQKCLESHKDINFFVDRKTLAEWSLNGRDISNAVTTARTLARDGTLNMEHLERVVPASKQRTYRSRMSDEIYEIVPSSKPKDKKKRKNMKFASDSGIKIFKDLANSDTSDLGNHKDWGMNRRRTRSPCETDLSDESVNKNKTFRQNRTSNWVGTDDSEDYSTQSPPPSPQPVSGERTRPYPNPWFFGPPPLPCTITPPYPPPLPPAFNIERSRSYTDTWGFRPPPPPPLTIRPPHPHPPSPRPTTSQRTQPVANALGFRPPPSPREVTPPHLSSPRPTTRERIQSDTKAWRSEAVEDEDDWGSFGTKKSKKASKSSAKESDVPKVTDSPPMPAINDSWGDWGSARKDKKSPQVKLPSKLVHPTFNWSNAEEEPPTMPDAHVDWSNFGRKKVKKTKKPSAKHPKSSLPTPPNSTTQPVLPPVEVDDWDSWLTSKTPNKGKKNRVINQSTEYTASPPERATPVTNAIPIEKPEAHSPPSVPHHPRLCNNCYANRPILRGIYCFDCTPSPPRGGDIITARNALPHRAATEKHHCLSCGGREEDLSGDELVCSDCQELYG